MKVFISWSGERSKAVANALKDLLPDVLQEVMTWMSEHDIDAGTRWSHRLSEILAESKHGVICLTPENQKAPWILYEAGALSKSVQESRLIPYLIDMSASDLESPLSQFQSIAADASGTFKLLESINSCSPSPLPTERLRRLFDRWWPDLALRIQQALKCTPELPKTPTRSDREILNEVLELVRAQSQARINPESVFGAYTTIEIDARPLLGSKKENVSTLNVDYDEIASRFLDRIWFQINSTSVRARVPAYTYGQKWLLKNCRTGQLYDNIGIEYCRSRGETDDTTPVSSLGLNQGDVLFVVPVNRIS